MFRKITLIFIGLMLITSTAFASNATSAAQNILKAPADLHAVKNSSSSIRLYWKKVDTATRYNIYYINHKTKKKKRIATTRKTYFYDRNLKSHKVHHYKVQAVRGSSRSKLSYAVCAKNWMTRNVTNMKRVNVNRHNVTVDLLENPNYMLPESRALKPHKVKAKVIASCGGKKPFNKNVRWFSTDSKIAKVKKDGTIIPVNGGKCEIYAKAQNGVNSKHIKLTVKDYAFVDSFAKPEGNYEEDLESMAVEILQDKCKELCTVVSKVSKVKFNKTVSIATCEDETYKIVGVNDPVLENHVKEIAKLPYPFTLKKTSRSRIKFTYGLVSSKTENGGSLTKIITGTFDGKKWEIKTHYSVKYRIEEPVSCLTVLQHLMEKDNRLEEYEAAYAAFKNNDRNKIYSLFEEYGLNKSKYSLEEADRMDK